MLLLELMSIRTSGHRLSHEKSVSLFFNDFWEKTNCQKLCQRAFQRIFWGRRILNVDATPIDRMSVKLKFLEVAATAPHIIYRKNDMFLFEAKQISSMESNISSLNTPYPPHIQMQEKPLQNICRNSKCKLYISVDYIRGAMRPSLLALCIVSR